MTSVMMLVRFMAGASYHFEDSLSDIPRAGDDRYPVIQGMLWNQFQSLPVGGIP